MDIVGFFKNIKAQISEGNKEVLKAIDDVFSEKAKCGCWGVNCCEGWTKLPAKDNSTKRYLYVHNDGLYFGTKENAETKTGGTRIDA